MSFIAPFFFRSFYRSNFTFKDTILFFAIREWFLAKREYGLFSWGETIKYHTLILTSLTGKSFMEPTWKQRHKCQPCSEFAFWPLWYNATDSQHFTYTFTGIKKMPSSVFISEIPLIYATLPCKTDPWLQAHSALFFFKKSHQSPDFVPSKSHQKMFKRYLFS